MPLFSNKNSFKRPGWSPSGLAGAAASSYEPHIEIPTFLNLPPYRDGLKGMIIPVGTVAQGSKTL